MDIVNVDPIIVDVTLHNIRKFTFAETLPSTIVIIAETIAYKIAAPEEYHVLGE